jgi:polygalacturonase
MRGLHYKAIDPGLNPLAPGRFEVLNFSWIHHASGRYGNVYTFINFCELICVGSITLLALATTGQAAALRERAATASADACYVTTYSAIPAATAACTNITLDNVTVPGNSTIDLSKLKKGTKVTFKGKTFWQYADANYPFIKVGGTDIELTAAVGAVLDGNGQSWWDGLGSNGGVAK